MCSSRFYINNKIDSIFSFDLYGGTYSINISIGNYKCSGGCYPQDFVHSNHWFSYCRTNSQNNSRGCNFFPSSWHNCNDCDNGVYDNEKYCPSCGSQQF